jgi:hypothetical protein
MVTLDELARRQAKEKEVSTHSLWIWGKRWPCSVHDPGLSFGTIR